MADFEELIMVVGRVGPTGIQLLGTSVLVRADTLATALHVIGTDHTNLVAILQPTSHVTEYQDTSDTNVKTVPISVKAVDTFRDICLLELPYKFVTEGDLEIRGADEAPMGLEVVTFGYPHAPEGRMVLTRQTTSVGARILIANGPLKSKYLVLNIQTRPGQSGSPVFAAASGALVALIIGSYSQGGGGGISLGGIDPSTLHQTTHAISTEYIGDMFL